MEKFRITEHVSEQDISEIYNELLQYNLSKLENSAIVPLGVFQEDSNGKKTAGLIGETFGNWLLIKYLWVSAQLRGQGIGSEILSAAEMEAQSRGVKYAFVDTFDFQAPEFYAKHGYTQVFKLSEYPYTGARYYYVKEF